MDKKRKQLLIAVVIAVAVFFLNQQYLESRIGEFKDTDVIKVVVAADLIRAGTPLKNSLIKTATIPKRFAPKARILVSQVDQFYGRELDADVLKGDYVLQNYFRSEHSVGPSLSAQLEGQNYRAVSLPVDDTNSFDRSIVSGDKIDIIFTFVKPPLNQRMSLLLLQDVPVIATGSYSAAEQEIGSTAAMRRYNTLTLKLSAADALKLNYARQEGKISLLLRNPHDSGVVALSTIGSVLDLLTPAEKERLEKAEKEQLQTVRLSEEVYKEQIKALLDTQRQQSKVQLAGGK